MLKIPAIRKIDDVTVYEDDAVWHRFYLIPSIPSVRRDSKGRPVFLLAIYHFPDEDREQKPDLPHGGGFMNFDVQFAVRDEQIAKAKQELDKWVSEEYARRRDGPAFKSLPEYAGSEPPQTEFADPLLSGGKVSMHTTQSTALVTGRFAEAPASLVSESTASFNVDLTENGAGFMKDLMVTDKGTGRIDLTPVSVIYDLQMWARLPPVAITVTGDSERVHKTIQTLSQTNRDNPCTLNEIETYRENGVNSSTLEETGIVEVHIDSGNAALPPEVLAELQKYALDLFDKMIEERFLAPVDPVQSEPLEFEDPLPARPAARFVGNRRSTIRLNPGTSRYKLRESSETATMKLEIKITRSDVVEWPLVGQATLESFLSGATKEEIGQHVVDLFPDDFKTLGVTVQPMINFEQSEVQALEVQTEYSGTDSSGVVHTTPGAFTFKAGATDPKLFDPTVIGGNREYKYRYRVILDDGSSGEYTTWQKSSSRALNISVTDPGRLKLDVSAATLNWDLLRGVTVRLTYRDAPGATPIAEQTYELTAVVPTRKWEPRLRGSGGLIEAQTTYFFKEDKVIQGEPKQVGITDTLFVVPAPQVDLLNVGMLPGGDWSEVSQVAVSLEYDAGGGLIYDKTFRFMKMEEFAEWTVLLRDPSRRKFRHKVMVSYKNGTLDESAWIDAERDQTLPIVVKGVPKLRINVIPSLVDFKATPVVTVSLSYGDQRKTLSFTEPKPVTFEAPLLADTREYAYEATWHPTDGDPVRSGPTRTADTELYIRKAQIVRPGKLDIMVRGFAVDFAATPFVDIQFTLKDGAAEARRTLILSQDQKNATLSVDVGDPNQRRYKYAVVYNLADGTRQDGPSGESEDPVLSITRFKA